MISFFQSNYSHFTITSFHYFTCMLIIFDFYIEAYMRCIKSAKAQYFLYENKLKNYITIFIFYSYFILHFLVLKYFTAAVSQSAGIFEQTLFCGSLTPLILSAYNYNNNSLLSIYRIHLDNVKMA